MGHSEIHSAFKLLWKSQCQPKHKVFFWLLISDRLSTRNILRRRHMLLDSYSCVLCNSLVEESVDHLFAYCSFARMCWDFIHIDIPLDSGFPALTSQMKDQLNSQFFMETIILLCWAIWMTRNDLIFKGETLNLAGIKRVFLRSLSFLSIELKLDRKTISLHGFRV